MKRPYIRRPKRRTLTRGDEPEFEELGFVRASARVGSDQSAVKRVGNAVIGGDFTGNARGQDALDIQVARDAANQVASGARAIVFGRASLAAGDDSTALGANNSAASAGSAALGTGVGVSGQDAVGLGSGLIVGGAGAVGVGAQTEVSAADALGVGFGVTASGERSVAIGFNAVSADADMAVIAGLHLYLQTDYSPLTQAEVLTEANYSSFVDLSAKVNKSGDTMTGPLVIQSNATVALDISKASGNVEMVLEAQSGSHDPMLTLYEYITRDTGARMRYYATANVFSIQILDGGAVYDTIQTNRNAAVAIGGAAVIGGANSVGIGREADASDTNSVVITAGTAGTSSSGANTITFGIAGTPLLIMSASASVFNEGGADVDVRFEGDGDANLLFLDAGNDRVGVGTNSPGYKLHVAGDVNVSSSFVYRVNGTQVVSARSTGWAAPTATQSKAGFGNGATSTQIEQNLSAVINALITHGLLGA